ncbi:hypothetical protein HELRODRAFT_117043, partial [Helobdella robusta]|uniref:Cytosol aminopeptidase n=1 Tax=Helobdella robusta TaxID=6412 RepID=T1EGJ6_HELRO
MLRSHNLLILATRRLAMATVARKGLVLGFYEGEAEGEVHLTKTAKQFQDEKKKCLPDLLQISGLAAKKGKCNLFVGLDAEYNNVVLTSLGKKGVGVNELEEIDEGKDNVRTGVAAGVKLLHDAGVKTISVDPCNEPEAAAEGAFLSVWAYDELKAADKRKPPPELSLAAGNNDVSQCWERGKILAEGQNLARYLMEGPANKITPTAFAKIAVEKLGSLANVTVTPRDKAWAQSMKMGAFLSVAQGSHEPPVFLEVKYQGAADASTAPLIFVGKGITFDSGGISIKPSENMDYMRADMGGAACALSAIYTAAKLKLPINLVGLMPLTENMPGGSATKPGDVHTAMNGKTIQIDNTDAEGRLVLSDALCYADTFNPCAVVDLATLTGGLVGWLVGWLVVLWLVSRLVVLWLVSRLAGWLVS